MPRQLKVFKSVIPEVVRHPRILLSGTGIHNPSKQQDSRPTDHGNDEIGRMHNYGFEDFYDYVFIDKLVKSPDSAYRWLSKNTNIQGVVFCDGS